jgi:hypothetical protein
VHTHLVEHDQRSHRHAERLEPELRLLERKFPARDHRSFLAIQRDGHAHVAHLILDGDLHADIEPLARSYHFRGAQPDDGVPLTVQQRFRQHVLARAVARALRHPRRKIRTRHFTHRRLVDSQLIHGHADVEARIQNVIRHEHRARQLVRHNHVVMTEARHGATAIHEDLQ